MTETTATAYFDTPERTERLQLVAHLLRNADVVPYVRGPAGAGKSLFAARLATSLRDEATVVTLSGTHCHDVPVAICQALGLAAGDWPAVVLDAPIDPALVVLVDDADDLDTQAQADLLALQAAGGRLLLLGRGDAATLSEQWPLQLIDLPPLTEAQARDFLAFAGGVQAALLSDAALHRLHQQSGGQPGPLLDGPADERIGSVSELPAGPPWKWLLGASAAIVVILVLWQQERINALFSPPPPATEPALVDTPQQAEPQDSLADNRIAIPPLPPEPTPAVASAVPGDVEVAVPAEPRISPETDDVSAPSEPAEQVTTAPVVAEEAPPRPTLAITAPVVAPVPEAVPMPAPPADAPLAIVRAPEPAPAAPLPAEPVPMVELAPPAPPVAEAVAPPAAAPSAPKPPLASAPAVTDDLAWLRSRQSSYFTLQLLGARDRAAIDQFIRTHRLKGKYAVFARDLNGKPWYSLVYGDYPDRDAALRGRAALPASLRGASVWPRTFASVWEQLPEAAPPR